ncbi:MAG: type IV pilin [Halovenus sp.]
MAGGKLSTDEKAISEMASVLTLVAIAFVIVFAIGANILFFEAESDGPDVSFSFQYFDELSSLQITHEAGEEVRAGDLLIEGPDREVTWAELDNDMNESSMVGPNDAVRLGPEGAYGGNVGDSDRIAVVYSNASADTKILSQWNGTR